MKTRKISAHYIFPGNSPPLKFGILKFSEEGTILKLIDTNGKLRETAGLEFYNGIIVPGFIIADIKKELLALSGESFLSPQLDEISQQILSSNHANRVVSSREGIKEVTGYLCLLQELLPACRLEEFIALFTSIPASILKIDDVYGSFEIGKKPGIINMNGLDLNNLRVNTNTVCSKMMPG